MVKNINNKHIILWLKLMCLAVICMIFIGGYTRLTHSGLSITQWKPVTGIIPPLNEETWVQEFNQYKLSPEYLKINYKMSLTEFKSIFWIEFVHRLAGRITGLLYLIPLVFFTAYGVIKGKELLIYCAGFIVLVAQGVAGWYMVKSGLADDPHVSHFRLALHLFLAVFLYIILFWQLIKNYSIKQTIRPLKLNFLNGLLNILLLLILVQIVFGAFVAGLNAGLIYNEFPLMGGSFIPHELKLSEISICSLSDPVFVQFIHRILAYVISMIVIFIYYNRFKILNSSIRKTLNWLILALLLQVALGIATLIFSVPITIALLHQLGAIFLISLILQAKYLIETND